MLFASAYRLFKSKIILLWNEIRYLDAEDQIFNWVISDISVVLVETTLFQIPLRKAHQSNLK